MRRAADDGDVLQDDIAGAAKLDATAASRRLARRCRGLDAKALQSNAVGPVPLQAGACRRDLDDGSRTACEVGARDQVESSDTVPTRPQQQRGAFDGCLLEGRLQGDRLIVRRIRHESAQGGCRAFGRGLPARCGQGRGCGPGEPGRQQRGQQTAAMGHGRHGLGLSSSGTEGTCRARIEPTNRNRRQLDSRHLGT